MNEFQSKYAVAKAAYDAAVEIKDWDLVEKIEDEFLDAEAALVEWVLGVTEGTGQVSDKEMETLRKNWTRPRFTARIVELAMRLSL